jgi:hypothetical protein
VTRLDTALNMTLANKDFSIFNWRGRGFINQVMSYLFNQNREIKRRIIKITKEEADPISPPPK